jgi:hypothetical protein
MPLVVCPHNPIGFFGQILPDCDGSVKPPRRGVGNHLFFDTPYRLAF